ncbi:hypothetical protein C8F01DRAFT_1360711 [Mycena amicta]|nr:hypothetical protein C8F01DRAFT_1360711 [Mycena amicta]
MRDSEPVSTPFTRDADRAQLAQLDAEIHKLQLALSALHAERKPVHDRLDSYIHPVMTLPNEIVSEIFIQYLPIYPACPPLFGDGSPTELAQICSRWRSIAVATPALWRAIELFEYTTGSGGRSLDVQVATMRTWLKRSGSLPLSILLGDNIPDNDDGQRAIAGALDDLLDHRARWEYVLLSLPNYDSRYSHRFQGPMPSLLQLQLQYAEEFELDIVIGRLDAPKLRNVSVLVFAMTPQRLVPCIPWVKLTQMNLRFVNPFVALAILRETENLVGCQLVLDDSTPNNSDTVSVVSLRRLKTFILDSYDYSAPRRTVECLCAIRAPGLKQLQIWAQLHSDAPAVLYAILQSIGCNLQRLCITRTIKPRDEYLASFPDVPDLDLSQELPRYKGWDPLELYLPSHSWLTFAIRYGYSKKS